MPAPTRVCLALALLVTLVAPAVLAGCTLQGGFTFYHPAMGEGPAMIRHLKGRRVRTPSQCRNKCNNHPKCFGFTHYEMLPDGPYGGYVQGHIYNCYLYDSRVKDMPQNDEAPGATLYYEKKIHGGRCW